jgi:hypothetical protein
MTYFSRIKIGVPLKPTCSIDSLIIKGEKGTRKIRNRNRNRLLSLIVIEIAYLIQAGRQSFCQNFPIII